MRKVSTTSLVVLGCFLAACNTTQWVHPSKSEDEYTRDYVKCQQDAARDPKLQQGSQLLMINAAERCMLKQGWRLVQKKD